MPVYVVTGKLGSGKTLASVGRIRDYLRQGRRVATNLDLNLNSLVGNYAKRCEVFRVPDRPLAHHLDSLGLGYDGDFTGEEKTEPWYWMNVVLGLTLVIGMQLDVKNSSTGLFTQEKNGGTYSSSSKTWRSWINKRG